MNKAEYDKYKNKVADLDGYDICDEFDLATWQLRDKKYLLQIVLMHYFEKKEENERLRKDYGLLLQDNAYTLKLEQRIDKAIEYINKCKNYHKTYHGEDKMFADELESLIMILQGSGKNQLITNNTMVNINGKVFHCSCGANVFSEYSNNKYVCNGCGNEFYGGNKK